jgi:hypothetical protein
MSKLDSSNKVETVYGGSGHDFFNGITTNINNDIICVGTTNSEGTGINTLLVKFSGSDLSIISKKVYDGTSADYFYGVATDANNDIICVGITASEEAGNNDVLVVKSVS